MIVRRVIQDFLETNLTSLVIEAQDLNEDDITALKKLGFRVRKNKETTLYVISRARAKNALGKLITDDTTFDKQNKFSEDRFLAIINTETKKQND